MEFFLIIQKNLTYMLAAFFFPPWKVRVELHYCRTAYSESIASIKCEYQNSLLPDQGVQLFSYWKFKSTNGSEFIWIRITAAWNEAQGKKTEQKHSGTNAYVNCRVKIKHVLWYSPLSRLSNRQSNADLWLCLSTLIIWTEREHAAESIPFSLVQGQQQEMAGWLRILLPLFSSPALHFFLQPKKQGSKKVSVDCKAEWGFIWLAFHMGADSNQFSCSALPSTVLKEGINVLCYFTGQP